jgi:hypothetical protein
MERRAEDSQLRRGVAERACGRTVDPVNAHESLFGSAKNIAAAGPESETFEHFGHGKLDPDGTNMGNLFLPALAETAILERRD